MSHTLSKDLWLQLCMNISFQIHGEQQNTVSFKSPCKGSSWAHVSPALPSPLTTYPWHIHWYIHRDQASVDTVWTLKLCARNPGTIGRMTHRGSYEWTESRFRPTWFWRLLKTEKTFLLIWLELPEPGWNASWHQHSESDGNFGFVLFCEGLDWLYRAVM